MIVKIQPSNPNIRAAVEYNERKMTGTEGAFSTEDPVLEGIEDGHVMATRNVPEGSTLIGEFERLTLLNLQMKQRGRELKNLSFHMSVNPSETDRPLGEKETVRLIDEIMLGLGYGKQPYRIYKHTDIERTHFHIVSCRAGQDGKKINSDFERLVLRRKLKELSDKYGFELVLSEEEKEEERKRSRKDGAEEEQEAVRPIPPMAGHGKDVVEDRRKKEPVQAFSRRSEVPVTEQVRAIAATALGWHFSSFEQVQALMLRRYNVLLEIERSGASEKAVFSGTDGKGTTITPILSEDEIFPDFLRRLTEKAGKEKMHNRREQRTRLEQLARASASIAGDYDEFKSLLEKKGVIVVLSWSREGKPFGVTYLDKATRCAWKGSETMADLQWLASTASSKGWTLTRDPWQRTVEKRASMPSRKASPTAAIPVRSPGHGIGTVTGGIYLPGHHEQSHAVLRGDGDDIEDDKPQELVQ